MPTKHVIQAGDSIIQLAGEHGLFADTLWQLRANRDRHGDDSLAHLRAEANALRAADAWLADVDEELVVGKLLRSSTNTFAVENESGVSLGSGIYIEASLFNHSCRPNVLRSRESRGPGLEFVTAEPVAAGTELTISYVPEGTLEERRARLQGGYFSRRYVRDHAPRRTFTLLFPVRLRALPGGGAHKGASPGPVPLIDGSSVPSIARTLEQAAQAEV